MNEPPKSAVSVGSGIAGSIALLLALAVGLGAGLSTLAMIFLVMGVTATASAVWDVVVDKVHLRPSTGLDWSLRRPASEIYGIVGIKLVGLLATFGLILIGYQIFRTYQAEKYLFYFRIIQIVAPTILIATPIYILFTTRYMVEPKDKLWHFGRFVTGGRAVADMAMVKDHLLGWTIKAFFLAFLVSIVPHVFLPVLTLSFEQALSGIVPFFLAVVAVMFFFDVCFGTFGYVMTFRPLDSHIRSANPYLSAWVFALICYPPFTLMSGSGPLNYHQGGQKWSVWLADAPMLLIVWGVAMAVLTAVYASATVIFGIRFSNLTHRGIITVGPYRYFKHPAYLSKNTYWWFASMPFLTTADDPMVAVRNVVLLAVVNWVYFMRAKTEEKHLMADPDYQAYSEWIAEHGVLPRLRRRLALGAPTKPVQTEPTSN